MKKLAIKLVSGAFLFAVMYLVVSDAMMTLFDLTKGVQYAFNMGAVVVLFPLGLYFFLGLNESEEDKL